MPVTFECESHWSNVEPGDDGWWWVYSLASDPLDTRLAPVYVGMTKHLPRRLAEHARFWTDQRAYAYVIGVWNEAAARSLEASLIGMLDPPGNTIVPHGSWLERRYLAGLRTSFVNRTIEVCEACGCFYQHERRWDVVTEPKDCENHERPVIPRGDIADVFGLPDLWWPQRQEGGDVLEQVPPDVVPPAEEGLSLDYEAFVDGP